jgi:beta-lactam-binding protein with PASTA domain
MTHRFPRRLAASLLVALVGAACAQPFAQLDGILVNERPALPSEFGRVQVTREGKARDGVPKMGIEKGDVLVTANDGVALTTLRAGYEIIFEPGTDATIENPSIFVRLGKLIVKTVNAIKEKLSINDKFVSSGVEGTLFTYEVTREQTRIAVLEGRVTVHSRTGGWDSVSYVAGEGGTIRATGQPTRMRVDPATAAATRRRIAVVEGAARPALPDLRGQTEAAARSTLQELGFRSGSSIKVVTREQPAGFVVSTRPAAGTVGKSGDRVTLRVADSSLMLPNVLGRSFAEATRIIRGAGFFRDPQSTTLYQADARVGSVIGMAPSGGDLISANASIVLTIATNTPPAVPQCTVPNLANLTEDQAKAALRKANFAVGKISQMRYGERVVTEQSKRAGTSFDCKAAIDFVIGTNIGE